MTQPSFFIEGIPVYKDILSTSLKNYPGYAMQADVIVIHETENHDKGANAEMHSRYLKNGAGGREASWHFTVDDKQIYWHIPLDKTGWHAGDGRNGRGNSRGIGIEHCENSDGDFKQTVLNGMALVRWIRKEVGKDLPVEPHKKFSSFSKNCPSNILPYWGQYVNAIGTKQTDLPIPQVPDAHPSSGGTYSGNSIVDYLNSIKADSSLTNRKRLADANGIRDYTGTASQNIELLDKLRVGGPSRKDDTPTKTILQMAIEVEQAKHGTGHDKRKASLGVSDAVYAQVRALVNQRAGVTVASKPQTPQGAHKGQTVTAKALYATAYSDKNVRKTPIKGYVDEVNPASGNWRNKIRLRNKKGGYYLGFTRQQDLV